MGVGEHYTTIRESIDVRRLHLRVPVQATDPIVLVIDGDEENIVPVGRSDRRWEYANHAQQHDSKQSMSKHLYRAWNSPASRWAYESRLPGDSFVQRGLQI